ncbi:MAG: sigma-70 family RNA polymerase sigma factor [Gemmatimonadaceae bacterium]|nr:sigma-70 family RNA polymerase sigma factor [Gemmatimonadaceae bacterium]
MDESMFTTEADRGSSALRRAALYWAADADDVEDLVQQTWLIAWQRRSSFRGDGDFVGWLLAVGRSVLSREWKKRRRERRAELSEAISDESLPPDTSVQSAHARDTQEDELLDLVMQLPARQRTVVVAHHGFGMSVKQVAEMLGRSPETVKATLAHAKKNLRGRRGRTARRVRPGVLEDSREESRTNPI